MKIFTGKFRMPCKMLKQWLQENNIEIEEVLAEDNMDEVEKYGVKQTPTLLLDDGTLIANKDDIIEYLENNNEEA